MYAPRYLNLPPGVEVLPNYRVTEITKKEVKMRRKSGEEMPGPEDPVEFLWSQQGWVTPMTDLYIGSAQ